MGQGYADVELGNPRRPDLAPVRIRALADTGTFLLCISPTRSQCSRDSRRSPHARSWSRKGGR